MFSSLGVVASSHPRAAAGGSPPTLVQFSHTGGSSTTLGATPTNGNLLVVATSGTTDYTTHTSLTTAGFTHAVQGNGAGWRANIWSKIASGDSATITVTEGLGTAAVCSAYEFDQALVLDQVAHDSPGGSASSASAGPTAALSKSVGLAVAATQIGGSMSDGAWSDDFVGDSLGRSARAHKILASSSGVQVTYSWTTNRNRSLALAVFT